MADVRGKSWLARLGIKPSSPQWSISEALLVLAALLVSMIVIASALAAILSGNTPNPEPAAFVIGWIVALMISGIFVLIRWRRSAEMLAGLKLGSSRYPLFLALLIGVAGAFTADLLASWGNGGFVPAPTLIGLNTNDIGQVIVGALLVVIVQPVIEGVIFAGVLLPRLRATLGGYAGLLLTGLLFAAYYGLLFGARLVGDSSLWYGGVFPLIIGLLALVIRAHTDSTRAAIAALVGAGMTSLAVMIAIS